MDITDYKDKSRQLILAQIKTASRVHQTVHNTDVDVYNVTAVNGAILRITFDNKLHTCVIHAPGTNIEYKLQANSDWLEITELQIALDNRHMALKEMTSEQRTYESFMRLFAQKTR